MVTAAVFEKAIQTAVEAHRGQIRKGDGRPYILHPISVMTRILGIKKSTNAYLLGTAAILHDVVEDCWKHLTPEQAFEVIAKDYGFAVASLVQELTLDKAMYEVLGKKEYLAREMVNMTSYALAIKLCDRLDNVSDMKAMSPSFQKAYTKETDFILERVQAEREHLTKTHKKLIKLINKVLQPYRITEALEDLRTMR